MKLNLQLNIRNKSYVIIAVVVILVIAVQFYSYTTFNKINELSVYRENLNSLQNSFLLLNRHERSFNLQYENNTEFFKTGDDKNITAFNKTYDEIKEKATYLRNSDFTKDEKLDQFVGNTLEYLTNYKKLFTTQTQKLKELGNSKYGIIYKLHQISASVTTQSPTPGLKVFADALRNSQLEYQISGEIKSYNQFISTYNQMVANIVSDTSYNEETILPFAKSMEEYFNLFVAYKLLTEEIGINEQEGIRGELKRQVQRIEPELSQSKLLIDEKIKDYKSITTTTFFLLLFLLVVILIAIIIQFASTIVKPMHQLRDFIKTLSKGDLPEKAIIFEQKDEIAEMADALNELVEGLKKTTQFATLIGKGHFDAEFTPLSKRDELGTALLDMRNNLNQAKIEEEKRNIEANQRKWANEGLTRFAELLRKNFDNYDEFTYEIISELVQYVDANQGALFLLNDNADNQEDDRYLELVAAYAYDRRKYIDKKVLQGEGLVGTCALEKQTIYITNLPQDYVTIASGLGQASPKSLLVVPLKLNQEVYGIVEIASFKEFKKYEIEFVEKIAESVSSTLQSVKINAKTARLLEQSRRQADEMAAQEEEMRQNLEELQATQEERSRREAEMRGILEAIDSSSLLIEIDTEGKVSEINDKYLSLINKSYDEVIGLNYWQFIQPDKSEKETSDFWQMMHKGLVVEEEHHILYDDLDIWLSQVYAPVIDTDDNFYKILNLATNITQSKRQQEELLEQAEEMAAQEEEMKQNFEALQLTQDEMEKKQAELEDAYEKMKGNEAVLKKAIETSREKEKEIREKNMELELKSKELHQNMEELYATQEQLSKKENELRANLNAVEQTSIFASFDMDGLLLTANQNFLDALGYEMTELQNMHHRMLIPTEHRRTDEYKNLWRDLNQGKNVVGTFGLLSKSEKQLTIEGNYMPLKSDDGSSKVILFGFNLTHVIGSYEEKIKELENKLNDKGL